MKILGTLNNRIHCNCNFLEISKYYDSGTAQTGELVYTAPRFWSDYGCETASYVSACGAVYEEDASYHFQLDTSGLAPTLNETGDYYTDTFSLISRAGFVEAETGEYHPADWTDGGSADGSGTEVYQLVSTSRTVEIKTRIWMRFYARGGRLYNLPYKHTITEDNAIGCSPVVPWNPVHYDGTFGDYIPRMFDGKRICSIWSYPHLPNNRAIWGSFWTPGAFPMHQYASNPQYSTDSPQFPRETSIPVASIIKVMPAVQEGQIGVFTSQAPYTPVYEFTGVDAVMRGTVYGQKSVTWIPNDDYTEWTGDNGFTLTIQSGQWYCSNTDETRTEYFPLVQYQGVNIRFPAVDRITPDIIWFRSAFWSVVCVIEEEAPETHENIKIDIYANHDCSEFIRSDDLNALEDEKHIPISEFKTYYTYTPNHKNNEVITIAKDEDSETPVNIAMTGNYLLGGVRVSEVPLVHTLALNDTVITLKNYKYVDSFQMSAAVNSAWDNVNGTTWREEDYYKKLASDIVDSEIEIPLVGLDAGRRDYVRRKTMIESDNGIFEGDEATGYLHFNRQTNGSGAVSGGQAQYTRKTQSGSWDTSMLDVDTVFATVPGTEPGSVDENGNRVDGVLHPTDIAYSGNIYAKRYSASGITVTTTNYSADVYGSNLPQNPLDWEASEESSEETIHQQVRNIPFGGLWNKPFNNPDANIPQLELYIYGDIEVYYANITDTIEGMTDGIFTISSAFRYKVENVDMTEREADMKLYVNNALRETHHVHFTSLDSLLNLFVSFCHSVKSVELTNIQDVSGLYYMETATITTSANSYLINKLTALESLDEAADTQLPDAFVEIDIPETFRGGIQVLRFANNNASGNISMNLSKANVKVSFG